MQSRNHWQAVHHRSLWSVQYTFWHSPQSFLEGPCRGHENCQLRSLSPSTSQTLKQHIPQVGPKLGRQGWYVGLGLSGLWLQGDGGPPALKGATTPVVSL